MKTRDRKLLPALALAGALLIPSCTLDDLLDGSGGGGGGAGDKVVLGLKTALEAGIDTSAHFASQVNGYLANAAIKILLPEEAEDALGTAEKVGEYVQPFEAELRAMKTAVEFFGADQSSYVTNVGKATSLLVEVAALESLGDSVVKYMNRAAEYAAPRSVPIFKGAITSMTIDDGLGLLNSKDSTAATLYLQGRTFSPLVTAYTPIVDSTLALVPLTRHWGDFRSAYNSVLANYQALVAFQTSWNNQAVVKSLAVLQVKELPAVANEPIETESLGAWTTDKALTGLFHLVGEEEKDIRRDPFAYARGLAAGAADLLKEVFGEIMEMQK